MAQRGYIDVLYIAEGDKNHVEKLQEKKIYVHLLFNLVNDYPSIQNNLGEFL